MRPFRSLDPDALTLINRMTVRPTRVREDLISDTVRRLKDAHIWPLLDALHVYAAHDSQAARLNWVSTSFTVSAVNSPTFTADRGYTGDGSTSYLNTGVNLGAGTTLATQNNHHATVYTNVGVTSATADHGGSDFGINASAATPATGTRSANTSQIITTGAASTGMAGFIRRNSGGYDQWKGAAVIANVSQATNPFASQVLFDLCRNNGSGSPLGFTTRRLALRTVGKALSDAQMPQLYQIFVDHLTAIGAQ